MSMRKCDDVPINGANAREHTVDARLNLFRAFPAGSAVFENLPSRPLRQNLLSRRSFVFAIIPFHQIRLEVSLRRKAGQFTRFPGALERTRQNKRKSFR